MAVLYMFYKFPLCINNFMKDQYLDLVCIKNAIPEFILKVYSILEKNEFEDIISWSQNNCEIHIKNPKALQEEVLPVYFRHRKIESFIRQLNMYRFSKVNKLNKEKHHMFFKNQLFRKGNIDSLNLIKRKKKGHNDEPTEPSEDNEAENLENYKDFVKENVYLIQEELMKVSKTHPEMRTELCKVLQYSNVILGQEQPPYQTIGTIPQDINRTSKHNLFQTIKQLFYFNSVRNFNSRCSIDGEIDDRDLREGMEEVM